MTAQNRVEERGDQHVVKKRKASVNGSSKRDEREGKASSRRYSEKESGVYDSPTHLTDGRRMKEKGRRPMTEHDRDARGDLRYDSYASEGVIKGGSKSVHRKGKRKEKDMDEHSSAEHGRRIVGGGGKDTTVSLSSCVYAVKTNGWFHRAMKMLLSVNGSQWYRPKLQPQRVLNVDLHLQNLDPLLQRLRLLQYPPH